MLLTFHDVLIGEHGGALGGGQAEVGEAHRGCQAEGDRKPAEATSDETPDTLSGKVSN